MTESTLWWLCAGGLVALELVTGTFYLLLISFGLVAAALVAHAGLSPVAQWSAAAVVGVSAVLAWRQFKPATSSGKADGLSMDVGQFVHVTQWNADGQTQVKYRGAYWNAILSAGEASTPGTHVIVDVTGNQLVLKKFTLSTP